MLKTTIFGPVAEMVNKVDTSKGAAEEHFLQP